MYSGEKSFLSILHGEQHVQELLCDILQTLVYCFGLKINIVTLSTQGGVIRSTPEKGGKERCMKKEEEKGNEM